MTFRVIARRIGDSWDNPRSWELAPYNDGKGGEYKNLSKVSAEDVGLKEALDEDFLALFIALLGDIPLVTANPDNILMLLDLDDGCPTELCIPLTPAIALPARGDAKSVRVVPQGDRSAQRDRDAGVRMSTDKQDWAGRLTNKLDKLALSSGTQPTAEVIWVLEGGKAAWKADMKAIDKVRQDAKDAAHVEEVKRQLKKRHDDKTAFINPYTFVPLPEKIERSSPRGHSELANDGFSGSFDWVLRLQTPLLLPSDDSDTTTGSILHYPGSSLRGALRSLHESLAGGCMRALEDDYVPVHRETMNALQSGDRLVVVRELDDMTDQVTKVELTEDLTWVNVSAIHPVIGPTRLRSGSTIAGISVDRFWNQTLQRHEIDYSSNLSAGSDWVLHLTESSALREKNNHNYYAAAGHLTGVEVSIGEEAWNKFVSECAGSKDLIGESGLIRPTARAAWPGIQVKHTHNNRKNLVGERRKTDGWLSVGDTLWLTKDGRLKMAAIWRRTGEKSVKDRLPHISHLPCTKPDNLCPTCAVFGSVSTARSADNEQAGYATHIHVGWGESRDPNNHRESVNVTLNDVQIAPLCNPKPSSGGFYLEAQANRAASIPATRNSHIPRSHWRPSNDPQNAPRKVRGRKQYWHGQVSDNFPRPRQLARNHHLGNQNGGIQAGNRRELPAGTVICSRVTFDNLSREQLAWLLAAATPSGFFNCVDSSNNLLWVHVGGGKPLGYGSALAEIENLQVFSAQSRYGKGESSLFDLEAAWQGCQESITSRGLEKTHKALKKVLKPNAVHADRIWYPTPQNFNQQGDESFDKAFNWFSDHTGGRFGNLVPLPDVLNDDQYLESQENQ